MAIDVVPGTAWQSGRPRPLFRAPVTGDTTTYRTRYAVSADGQLILVDSVDEGAQEPLTLIVNWPRLAQR
jgi:hypothetical protein